MNGWTFTWQGGRQLAGMTNGTTSLEFTYNDSGLRTTKTVGGVTHTYYYHGSTLVADITDSYGLYFHYNANGSPVGLTYDIYDGDEIVSAKYYYIKNLQGDIIGIMHSSGDLVASYTYDAWGNVLSADDHEDDSGLCNRNPLRYRGYYYDSETKLYYLQSRYYDPAVGRFLNADGLIGVTWGSAASNTFSYCVNNPIKYSDPMGCKPEYVGDSLYQWAYDLGWWLKDTFYMMPTKEEHYSRNDNNPEFPDIYDAQYYNKSKWDDSVPADCHQFSAENKDNKKYVSVDGHYEVIYDVNGHIVTDPRDVGTYNFISPIDDPLGHFIVDVYPWIRYGNSPEDTTEWHDRLGVLIMR